MADTPEVIQQQMEETRTRLAENLDKLSQQTSETVGEVASTVTQTVENVQETAQAVSETMQTVSETVQQTVSGVKDMLDIPAHVERHPLLMMGGSIALGFLAGRCLMPSEHGTPQKPPQPKKTGNGVHHAREKAADRLQGQWPAEKKEEKNWLSNLTETFGPALEKLKGLAVGAALGIARDAMTRSVSEEMAGKIREIVDDVTERLGGKPVPVSKETSSQPSSPTGAAGPKPESFAAEPPRSVRSMGR